MLFLSASAKLEPPAPPTAGVRAGAAPPAATLPMFKLLIPLIIEAADQLPSCDYSQRRIDHRFGDFHRCYVGFVSARSFQRIHVLGRQIDIRVIDELAGMRWIRHPPKARVIEPDLLHMHTPRRRILRLPG